MRWMVARAGVCGVDASPPGRRAKLSSNSTRTGCQQRSNSTQTAVQQHARCAASRPSASRRTLSRSARLIAEDFAGCPAVARLFGCRSTVVRRLFGACLRVVSRSFRVASDVERVLIRPATRAECGLAVFPRLTAIFYDDRRPLSRLLQTTNRQPVFASLSERVGRRWWLPASRSHRT